MKFKAKKKTNEMVPSTAGPQAQIEIIKIVNFFIILGIFGFIPGAWALGMPLVLFYSVLKRKSIEQAILSFQSGLSRSCEELAQTLGDRLGDAVSNHPASLLKSAIVLSILLFSGINTFSLIALYGVYAYTSEEWQAMFKDKLKRLYIFFNNFVNKLQNSAQFETKMVRASILVLILTISISLLGLIVFPLTMLEIMFIWIGMNAVMRDLQYALKKPIQTLLEHSGKIIGASWGHWFSYLVFKGSVGGSIGNPVGYLQNNGLFANLFAPILNPIAGFSTSTGFFNTLLTLLRNLVNGIFTSVFITQEVHLQGEFFGTVGPSAIQVFAMMGFGALLGYVFDFTIRQVEHALNEDTRSFIQKDKQWIKENWEHTKYHGIFLGLATPFILASEGGRTLIAICDGSILGAGIFTVGLMAISSALIHSVAKRVFYRTPFVPQPVVERVRKSTAEEENFDLVVKQSKTYTPALYKSVGPEIQSLQENTLNSSPNLFAKKPG